MKDQPRSPKLRNPRPFQIRYGCWFGNTPLNGMVWKITIRRGDHYLTVSLRDGGPLCPHATLSDALAYVREMREKDRTGVDLEED